MIINPDLKTTYSQDLPMKSKDFLDKHLDGNNDDIINYLKKMILILGFLRLLLIEMED